MNHDVQAPLGTDRFGQPLEIFVPGYVALEHARGLELGAQFFDGPLEPVTLVSEQKFRSLALKRLRNGIGKTPFIGDAQDERGPFGKHLRHESALYTGYSRWISTPRIAHDAAGRRLHPIRRSAGNALRFQPRSCM